MIEVAQERRLHPLWQLLYETWKGLLVLLLVAIVAGGSAFFVTNWLLVAERKNVASLLTDKYQSEQAWAESLKALQEKLIHLEETTGQLQQQWEKDSLPLDPSSAAQVKAALAEKFREVEGLKEELQTLRGEMEEKVARMEQGLKESLGKGATETTSRFDEIRFRTILLQTRSQVLKARTDLFAKDAGRALQEVELAAKDLTALPPGGSEADQNSIREVLGSLTQIRKDLSEGLPTGLDRLELLWHQLGLLLEKAP